MLTDKLKRRIFYRMAPKNSYYKGLVMRAVEKDLGQGVIALVSETSTGMDFAEFSEKHPTIPIEGKSDYNLRQVVQGMSDEQLAAMGLSRDPDFVPEPEPDPVGEVSNLKPTHVYPKFLGGNWWELSDGNKIQGKSAAVEAEAAIAPDELPDEE